MAYRQKKRKNKNDLFLGLGLWSLTPLSTIFQAEYKQKTTDLSLYRVLIGIDCVGSCNSTYHMITSTTAPPKYKETQKLNSVILFKSNISIRYSIDRFFLNTLKMHMLRYRFNLQMGYGNIMSFVC